MSYSSDSYKLKDLIIRPSTLEDVKRFTEIENKCFSDKYRYGSSILATLVNIALDHTIFSAQLNNLVVGFIVSEIADEDPKLGRIISIQVDPVFQRKSIGHKLLKSVEKSLNVNYGIKTIQLQVHYENKNAISFYITHGYRILKEIRNYYDRKEHALLMERKLTQN